LWSDGKRTGNCLQGTSLNSNGVLNVTGSNYLQITFTVPFNFALQAIKHAVYGITSQEATWPLCQIGSGPTPANTSAAFTTLGNPGSGQGSNYNSSSSSIYADFTRPNNGPLALTSGTSYAIRFTAGGTASTPSLAFSYFICDYGPSLLSGDPLFKTMMTSFYNGSTLTDYPSYLVPLMLLGAPTATVYAPAQSATVGILT
jgi:hypothetical protein